MNSEVQIIQTLSHEKLIEQTDTLVKEERRIGLAILHRLAEISRRMLYLELGYSSMFKFCTGHLKYHDSTAYRLLDSMKVLLEIPEIESKIESGALSVSSISKVQSFVRAQKNENGLKIHTQTKKAILQSIEGCSKKGTEKILATLFPEHPLLEKREYERPINASETEIQFIANDALLSKLNQIRDLMAHTNWNPTYAELLDRMADIVLDKIDPIRIQQRIDLRKQRKQEKDKKQETKKKSGSPENSETICSSYEAAGEADGVFAIQDRAEGKRAKREDEVLNQENSKDVIQATQEMTADTSTNSDLVNFSSGLLPLVKGAANQIVSVNTSIADTSATRYISPTMVRKVWIRDKSRCTYVCSSSGKRCLETRGLQIEHVKDWGLGGNHELSNLTLFCSRHNIHAAVKTYGRDKMAEFLDKRLE